MPVSEMFGTFALSVGAAVSSILFLKFPICLVSSLFSKENVVWIY